MRSFHEQVFHIHKQSHNDGRKTRGPVCFLYQFSSHAADADHLVLMLIAQVLLYYHLTLLTTSECSYCLTQGFAEKGGVSASAAQLLHAKSGSQASFEATWQLVSPGPVSASLDCSSFCLFMHLLKTSMKGIQLPASIWPDEVSMFAFRALLLCTDHMHRRLLSAGHLRKENSFYKDVLTVQMLADRKQTCYIACSVISTSLLTP